MNRRTVAVVVLETVALTLITPGTDEMKVTIATTGITNDIGE